nr:zinc finger protein 32-like [Leptinotarsa decemlineata]
MASFECGRQIKREVQTVDEVPFQRHDVKSEPGEAEMFSKCGRNGDASDTYMSTNDLDENDELKVNMPIDKFDPEEIKIEKICFIPYFDLKSEKCEKAIKEGSNLKECEEESFSHENGSSNSWRNHNESRAILLENITEGSKPSVGFTKDTGNILVEIKEETIFEEKKDILTENIPSGPEGMEFVVENDHVKHKMVPTIVDEQYYSTNCLNSKTSEKLLTGKKPFQCKICSKSFIQESALKYHEKIHSVL